MYNIYKYQVTSFYISHTQHIVSLHCAVKYFVAPSNTVLDITEYKKYNISSKYIQQKIICATIKCGA